MLLTSMTGYGRAETKLRAGVVTIEMKSVNHRYAEVIPRFPKEFLRLEDDVRKLVLERISRGRVDVYLSISDGVLTASRSVQVDESLLKAAIHMLMRVSTQAEVDFEAPSIGHLLSLPGLFVTREDTPSLLALTPSLMETAQRCLQELIHMRRKEGKRLSEHLLARLKDLLQINGRMAETAPHSVANYKEKLVRRLEQTMSDNRIDEGRVALEVALVAERTSIEEELKRFDSHLQQFHGLLSESDGAVGRRLDFLLQEMNREVNTIGAKCADLAMTESVLAAKHILEQMREQVQNVE